MNVLLLAIRPQPVLTLCHRHDRKTFRYVASKLISLNDYDVPTNIACDAIIIMTIVIYLLIAAPPLLMEGPNIYVLICS